MHRQSALIALSIIILLSYGTDAQQTSTVNSVPTVQPSDRSPYLGNPVAHPEALSGLWETSNGHGGAVGIHLLLTTTVPGDARTLYGITQSWQSFEVGIYERKGVMIQFGEQNYFSDSPRGGNVSFEGRRLRLHFVPRVVSDPAIDVDLVHDADGSWTGRFHRGTFDSNVMLRRPAPRDVAKVNPIVGAWLENRSSISSCVHIAQQSSTDFTGWSDSLQLFGSMRVANSVARPATAMQRYGELMKVDLHDGGKVSLELYAYTAICCSHSFVGTLTPSGTLIEGAWPPGPNQAPHDSTWRKTPSDSCTTEYRTNP
jgi:hypothetical protein